MLRRIIQNDKQLFQFQLKQFNENPYFFLEIFIFKLPKANYLYSQVNMKYSPLFIFFFSTFFYLNAQNDSDEKMSNANEKAIYYLEKLQEHYGNGEYELHKTYTDSLQSISKEYGLSKMYIISLTNQAIYYNNKGQQQKSIPLFHTALEKCKEIPDDKKTKTVVLVNLGNTYYDIKLYTKAIDAMEKVLIVANFEENSGKIKAAALIGLSNSYSDLGELDKALDYLYQAKKLGEEINNNVVILSSVNDICDILYQQKKYAEAITIGNSALKYTKAEEPTKHRAWLFYNLGKSYFKLNEASLALTNLEEALAIGKKSENLEVEMYCHEYLAQVYESEGNIERSHEEQKAFIKTQAIFLNNTTQATQLELKKEIDDKDSEITENNKTISSLLKNKKMLIFSGSFALLILSGFLFFYVIQKKKEKKNILKIQAQYSLLKEEIQKYNKVGITKDIQPENISLSKNDRLKGIDELVEKVAAPYKNSSLSIEDRKLYKNSILELMKHEKPYLNASLNHSELANNLRISSHHLSEVLHYEFEQNFYNFINSYRIIEAQDQLKDPKNIHSKMIAIAFDSGFKSKTSFNRAFKNYTGLTPSEYKNSL
ncbi:tetratricopeptide repeat protein [uncultured Maribacter sp.]|uniref:tetratricopeptide repeat protein n=1 Tax=uncultured Maribacter sp. TaxID=431308 RepID=UPI0026330262|nr:tetratricopeptide repeat protein [uncultured Maribacter sp.]